MENLWPNVKSSVTSRLGKFLNPGARSTMLIIKTIVTSGSLKRPEYWGPTVDWVITIQNKFPENFDEMSPRRKVELAVFAMAIGHASSNVHFNFSTSESLLDFMVMASEDAIATEMDKRSDPRVNQISQVARA
jgi:hypothetical protein